MPTTRRSREVPAAPDRVWAVVADIHTHPRWWPKVARVEGVGPEGFTHVMQTAGGRPVRADHRIVTSDPLERLAWEQDLTDSPFERVLRSARTTVSLAGPAEGPTTVTIELRQQMRGMSRFGGFLVRRATGRILDQALDGLAARV